MNIIKFVSDSLCIDSEELISFSSTAPYRYKIYNIPKRSGEGVRTIAHPSKQLKFIQRLMLSELEKLVIVHESCFAYKRDTSIRDNAMVHCNNKYLLKMDFKDFFPSITPDLLFQQFNRANIEFSSEDKNFMANIFFFKLRSNSALRLSIGAPSSPLISNFVMYSFDKAIVEQCENQGIQYTRYADDITFSTNKKNALFNIPELVTKTLKENGYKQIRINREKTVFSSKKHNRHITGVTISNDGTLSVGRDRKRIISAAIHKFSMGEMNDKEIEMLQGHVSFATFIEPALKARIIKKYGANTFNNLFNHKKIS